MNEIFIIEDARDGKLIAAFKYFDNAKFWMEQRSPVPINSHLQIIKVPLFDLTNGSWPR